MSLPPLFACRHVRHMVRCALLCGACAVTAAGFAHPGQHDQLEQINRHIEEAPAEQALYIQRGVVYSESGEYDRALADYHRAQTLGPPVLVSFELGVLRYRQGEYQRASDHLERYLQRFPDYAPAYEYLARIARDAGDPDTAIAHFETYFRLQERPNPGLYLSAAKIMEETGRPEQALAMLDQGLAKLGVIPQLQRQAIRLELFRQRPDLAIARLETLRDMLRDNPQWKLDMAELLWIAERREEAIELLGAARSELLVLRPTPARTAAQQRATEMMARFEAGQDAPVTSVTVAAE